MIYPYIRKILFQLEPETAHHFTLKSLKLANQIGLLALMPKAPQKPVQVMGLNFKNPVGLAAGLDRNGEYIEALAALGFGFIEIGTVVPQPQVGNPKPRLFRLVEQQALINRIGFASKGLEYVLKCVSASRARYTGILGINIGKNKDTPNEKAVDDYLICFRALWAYADYITMNVSSPNTPGLRELQEKNHLATLLSAMKTEQQKIVTEQRKYIPLVLKISPDLEPTALHELAAIVLEHQIDGVIATNTTISRIGVEDSPYAKEMGGLSGKPLRARNTEIIKLLHEQLQDRIPIIGLGGIFNAADANEKINAGAKLLQVYTGLIYQGPRIVHELVAGMN